MRRRGVGRRERRKEGEWEGNESTEEGEWKRRESRKGGGGRVGRKGSREEGE